MVCCQEGRDRRAREWKKLKVLRCQISKPLLVQVRKSFALEAFIIKSFYVLQYGHLSNTDPVLPLQCPY